MKTYIYHRSGGVVLRIEAEQMFWSGTACVFVKGGLAAAVISLLPGEIIHEQGIGEEKDSTGGESARAN